jgi:hypothetical protein
MDGQYATGRSIYRYVLVPDVHVEDELALIVFQVDLADVA